MLNKGSEQFIQPESAAVGVQEEGAKESINPKEKRFLQELQEGRYLGILETYVSDEKWSLERVARDTWQNFFDANDGNLDGIEFDTREENGEMVITIRGAAEYDFRHLLSFGAGTKTGSTTTAGKYGEGTRIYALHMLRDYGFRQVKFQSGEWELEFYLDKAPAHEVPEEMRGIRGLFAKLKLSEEKHAGNQVEFITANRDNVEAIRAGQDLFYHSQNSDFHHPDIDTDKGGLKIHFGQPGNLYINGQRIHYNSRDQWQTLPDISAWSWETPRSHGQTIKIGRERSLVTIGEMERIVLPFLVDSITTEECQLLLAVLEPVYDPAYRELEGETLLSLLVARLEVEGYRHNFSKNLLADDVSPDQADLLKKMGYEICRQDLSKIGMTKASEELGNIGQEHEVEMSDSEKKRAELVQNAIARFLQEAEVDPEIQARPARAFIGEHPCLEGRYEEGWVWINQFVLRHGDLAKLLALYKHEICHTKGSDESAQFTYAYTDLDEAWTRYLINHPEVLPELQSAFSAIPETETAWQSFADFDRAVDPFLQKEARDSTSPLEYRFWQYHESEIDAAKFSLATVIDDKFSHLYSARNCALIYQTVFDNPTFKKVWEHLNKPETHLSQEEESVYRSELAKLRSRKNSLERMIQVKKSEIAGSTKRTSVVERAIQKSQIPVWERELEEIGPRIAELEKKLETSSSKMPYLMGGLKSQTVFEREVDLQPFLNLGDFIVAALELIIEKGQEQQRPLEDIVNDIDEALIYLKKNSVYPREIHNAIILALARIKPAVFADPNNQINLGCAQRLFGEFMKIHRPK